MFSKHRWRVAAVSVSVALGVVALCWPLLMQPDADLTQSRAGIWVFVLVSGAALLVGLTHFSTEGLSARHVALLGVLAAIGAIARPLGGGAGGVEVIFVLFVLAGRVFGTGFGYLLGSVTLLASALITGGVGPWLPYQMIGASWVGAGAGLLPQWEPSTRVRRIAELCMLSIYACISSVLYGVALNLSFWPYALNTDTTISFQPGAAVTENLSRLWAFSVATSAGWDALRAITTVALIVVAGPIVLRVLRREQKFSVTSE